MLMILWQVIDAVTRPNSGLVEQAYQTVIALQSYI